MSDTCKTCRFYRHEKTEHSNYMLCLRYPEPTQILDTHWCGDHRKVGPTESDKGPSFSDTLLAMMPKDDPGRYGPPPCERAVPLSRIATIKKFAKKLHNAYSATETANGPMLPPKWVVYNPIDNHASVTFPDLLAFLQAVESL